MDIFFNELSVRLAKDDTEARGWLEELARLGALLEGIIRSMDSFGFTFRRSEDFGELMVTNDRTIRAFLNEEYEPSDPVHIFLYGIFDSPYIDESDPQRTDFEYTSLEWGGVEHPVTGLGAAHLKQSLAVSLNSDTVWDTCTVSATIHHLDPSGSLTFASRDIRHASREQHVIDCHLEFLAGLFDWATYKAKFDSTYKTHTLLPMLKIYSLKLPYVGDAASRWQQFYREINHLSEVDRIAKIRAIVDIIATLQGWQLATGTLQTANAGRHVYTIPGTADLIIGVDTQHGEFEVHRNHKGNNHLGAVSFDGKRIKGPDSGRRINI